MDLDGEVRFPLVPEQLLSPQQTVAHTGSTLANSKQLTPVEPGQRWQTGTRRRQPHRHHTVWQANNNDCPQLKITE